MGLYVGIRFSAGAFDLSGLGLQDSRAEGSRVHWFVL